MDSLNRPNVKENFFVDRVLKYIVDIVVALMLAVLFITTMAYTTTAKGNSMSPTINADDDILVDKLAFRLFSAKKGDVVVMYLDNSEFPSVKRVLGTPGDTIKISYGVLYINGEEQKYIDNNEAIVIEGDFSNEITLGKDEYFVIGDNWNNSTDSRHKEIGLVSSSQFFGKAWFVVSPFSDFGFVF